MEQFGLRFHHIGMAVRSTEKVSQFLRALGYQLGEPVYDPLQKVNLAMCRHVSMPEIEMVWPGSGQSPVDNLLKRQDSAMYHFCYVAAEPEASLAAMEAAGMEVLAVAPPHPAVLFGGSEVSFYSVSGVGLIELIHGEPGSPQGGGPQIPHPSSTQT